MDTSNSQLCCVKFKQRETEKVLWEQLRASSLAKLAVSGECRDTGGDRFGKLLSEQKGASIDAKK